MSKCTMDEMCFDFSTVLGISLGLTVHREVICQFTHKDIFTFIF